MSTAAPRPSLDAEGYRIENLRFAQGARTILEDLRLRIAPGEFICLLEPTGNGKTCLLRLLAGLDRPVFGRVLWNGCEAAGRALDRGAVFEDCGFVPWLSLEDNMAMAIDAARPNTPSLRCQELAGQYLDLVGLRAVGSKRPPELSRGMRQRGAIARALAMGSPVQLLDDPFCVLDPGERRLCRDLLGRVHAAANPRPTVILATNDLGEALALADRVVGLGPVPGPVMLDVPVAAARRDPSTLEAIRRRIEDLYRQEDRRRRAAEEFFGLGAGI
jgi:NitT/TauT family transport system ATP-binding protein